jgi:5-formyltetrahydrofolate cyclo-ligase
MARLEPAAAKHELREKMRAARAAIPPSDRATLSARVEARLLALPELRGKKTVLLFYSFGTEIPTAVLVRRLFVRGWRVLLPYLKDESSMEAGEIRRGDPLEATGYGPKEPARRVAVEPGEVDVVVTPGLAFDAAGRRLGYGGGSYDRYLARLHPHAVRIGIGFASQVVGEVPTEDGDERVDVIVTDRGVVRVGESS